MGANYYASAVIGVLVPEERLYTRVQVRAFDHIYAESIKFCPETGQKCWRERWEPTPEHDPENETFLGMPLFGDDGPRAVGYGLHNECDIEKTVYQQNLPTLDDLQALRVKLDQAGLTAPLQLILLARVS